MKTEDNNGKIRRYEGKGNNKEKDRKKRKTSEKHWKNSGRQKSIGRKSPENGKVIDDYRFWAKGYMIYFVFFNICLPTSIVSI